MEIYTLFEWDDQCGRYFVHAYSSLEKAQAYITLGEGEYWVYRTDSGNSYWQYQAKDHPLEFTIHKDKLD